MHTLVNQLFNGEVEVVMTDEELKIIFYISGWTIHVMAKYSTHWPVTINLELRKYDDNVTLGEKLVGKKWFVDEKIDTRCHFGGLRYSSKE